MNFYWRLIKDHLNLFQVFPLLTKKFSCEEQADLVWQFLCNIPVNMMADFLPWLSTSVSPDEHQDIRNCLCKVVPDEKLLQQVSMSAPLIFSFNMTIPCFFISC